MAKIAIDAGHGKHTLGKRCLKSLDKNETREWILNDQVADKLETYLKSAGHETLRVDDVTGNTDVSLANRVKKANEWEADYYISVHHNAGIKGGSGGGTVVYKYNGSTGITKTTQEAIYKYAVKHANLKGNRSNGTPDGNFYVIGRTSMPSALIECGFMDSATDIKYILDPVWSGKIALGIAEGICSVFGGTVKIATTTTATSNTSFLVKVDKVNKGDVLNIRKEPNAKSAITGKLAYNDPNTYTIIETKNGWGLLKSKIGWVNLAYTKTVSGSAPKTTTTTSTTTTATKPVATSKPVVKKPDVIYQVYAGGKWLNTVTNYNNTNSNGYAGVLGKEISGIRVKLSNGKTVTVRSHILGNVRNNWLAAVTKWDDTSNGYSGWKGKPIDCVAMKADGYTLKYRVHIKGGKWLGWVSKYDINNYSNGLAGAYGKRIDAIQIMLV